MKVECRVSDKIRKLELIKNNPLTVWVKILGRMKFEEVIPTRIIKRHKIKHGVKL